MEALCNSFKCRAIANSTVESSAFSTMLLQFLDLALQSSQDISYADDLFQSLVSGSFLIELCHVTQSFLYRFIRYLILESSPSIAFGFISNFTPDDFDTSFVVQY